MEYYNDLESESHLQKKAADVLAGTKFDDLFPSEFMKQYTEFKSIEELLAFGGFVINSEEDYDSIPDKEIDAHIAKTTQFKSWREMLTNAIQAAAIIKISN